MVGGWFVKCTLSGLVRSIFYGSSAWLCLLVGYIARVVFIAPTHTHTHARAVFDPTVQSPVSVLCSFLSFQFALTKLLMPSGSLAAILHNSTLMSACFSTFSEFHLTLIRASWTSASRDTSSSDGASPGSVLYRRVRVRRTYAQLRAC